jgi:hypothetical protein
VTENRAQGAGHGPHAVLIDPRALEMAGIAPGHSALPLGPGQPPPPAHDGPSPSVVLDAASQALCGLEPGPGDAWGVGRLQGLADRLAARTEGTAPLAGGYAAAFEEHEQLLLAALAARARAMREQLGPVRDMAGREVPEGCELSVRQMLTGARGALERVVDGLELAAELLEHAASPHPHPPVP